MADRDPVDVVADTLARSGAPAVASSIISDLAAAGFALFRPGDSGRFGVGAWRCNNCGEDCRLDAGCADPDYDAHLFYLVPVADVAPNVSLDA